MDEKDPKELAWVRGVVKPNQPPRVLLSERDDRHPNGEVLIAGTTPVLVAKTAAVYKLYRDGDIEECEPPANPHARALAEGREPPPTTTTMAQITPELLEAVQNHFLQAGWLPPPGSQGPTQAGKPFSHVGAGANPSGVVHKPPASPETARPPGPQPAALGQDVPPESMPPSKPGDGTAPSPNPVINPIPSQADPRVSTTDAGEPPKPSTPQAAEAKASEAKAAEARAAEAKGKAKSK